MEETGLVDSKDTIKAEDIIKEIKKAGIRFVIALPDRTTSQSLLKTIMQDPDLRVVQVCKEDEGISICSGLYCAGERALLLIQYTGLLDSINALRGVAMEGQNPICIMVGLLGKKPGVPPTKAARYGLRIVEPILDVMEIKHHLLETTEDNAEIVPAIEQAYARCGPVVMLIGREPL
jgi:sulfopyruvate decarboxylase subunit beta